MNRFLIIRHGQTEWNKKRMIMGPSPIGLNERGREQALGLAGAIKNLRLDAIYSSPILRAQETAEILGESQAISFNNHAGLEEVNYGDWVGKSFAEVKALPDYQPYYLQEEKPVAPNGESLVEVQNRIWQAFLEIDQQHENANIALVSHADSIKCLLMKVINVPLASLVNIRIDNCSVSVVETHSEINRLISINQAYEIDTLFKTRMTF